MKIKTGYYVRAWIDGQYRNVDIVDPRLDEDDMRRFIENWSDKGLRRFAVDLVKALRDLAAVL